MALIRNRALLHDAPRPERAGEPGELLVTLAHWRAERGQLSCQAGRLRLRLDSGKDLATAPHALAAELADDLARLAVIEFHFAAFSDGRAFSHARVLRERFGFRGELRASGDLLPDQLRELERCGFDSVHYPGPDEARAALAMVGEIDVELQPAGDAAELIFRRRHRAALSLVR